MSERRTLPQLPRFAPERLRVAEQLRRVRILDQRKGYKTNRDLEDYQMKFEGLDGTFEYIKSLKTSTRVLDIGAGTTQAVAEIANSDLGEGLSFQATVLSANLHIGKNLGYRRTLFTYAETLKGIESSSIAGVLAMYSVAYSAEPEMAMRRVNEVLIPGGVIKATFHLDNMFNLKAGFAAVASGLQTHDRFSTELKELGYDVKAVGEGDTSIMLAIKPGGEKTVTAAELLEKDRDARRRVFFEESGLSLLLSRMVK